MSSQPVSAPASSSAKAPSAPDQTRLVLGICSFLVVITWFVFGQTIRYDFVTYDDDKYVYENPIVKQGVTVAGLRWALTYGAIGHWHPLTWLTHMLDCEIYGLKPGGHHLTNVLLHTAAVIGLFLTLRSMTGLVWRSAFVAAVFAVHPLRVESVAWIAERKDVLSGFFFMLTLAAYVRYTRHPFSLARYGLVMLFFALGLLSKNMLVTMPFVLLLLDFWPLGRMAGFTPPVLRRLVVEKIPLLGLTVLSCVATALVPEKIPPGDHIPLEMRLENVVLSYVIYLWDMIHPVGLCCLYVYPATPPPHWHALVWLALLVAITGAVYAGWKTRPWLAVGWLWYMGMALPAIGIIQISFYEHADRYTYLPQIGLYLALTWLAADAGARWRFGRPALVAGGAVILGALIIRARAQTATWRNGESMWAQAVACNPDNYVAHYGIGISALPQGKVDVAITEFRAALKLKPEYKDAQYYLANACYEQGDLPGATMYYRQFLRGEPGEGGANETNGISPGIQAKWLQSHINLGVSLINQDKLDDAIIEFQKAVQLAPDEVTPRTDLGSALLLKGQVDAAIFQIQKALQLNPNSAEAHHHLASALVQKGEMEAAIREYQDSLRLNPDYLPSENDLAWELATNPQTSIRNGAQAVALAERADQASGGGDFNSMAILAAAYAEAGRFADAQRAAQAAINLAQAAGHADKAAQIKDELKQYQAGSPFHRMDK